MTLSSISNTVNALGIFGRLEPEQEKYFLKLESKYGNKADLKKKDIFNHLSLVINKNVPVGLIPEYINLLKELKSYLPFRIDVTDVIIIDGTHLALSFNTKQTEEIRNLASRYFEDGIIETYYTKVVWNVPAENQKEAIKELKSVREMIFSDFILVANKQNDKNTIYSSNRY